MWTLDVACRKVQAWNISHMGDQIGFSKKNSESAETGNIISS